MRSIYHVVAWLLSSSMLCCAIFGCPIPYALGILGGAIELETRMSAAPCRSTPCDRERWLVGRLWLPNFPPDRSRLHVIWPSDVDYLYDLHFTGEQTSAEFPQDGLTSASVRRHDLRLAVVTADGMLHLARFGEGGADANLNASALGVAWSNSGDRLAVVSGGSEGLDRGRFLRILTPELELLTELPLALPARPDGALLWRYVVSWNAGDTHLAVSTDDWVATTNVWDDGLNDFRPVAVAACVILDLRDGASVSEELSNAYFVGADTLVAASPGASREGVGYGPGQIVLLRINPDGSRVRSSIRGPVMPRASDPATGAFATIERETLGVAVGPLHPTGLRTLEAGPDLVSGFSPVSPFDVVFMVPLDAARPVLRAGAGNGVKP